jgi:hypothetical protein
LSATSRQAKVLRTQHDTREMFQAQRRAFAAAAAPTDLLAYTLAKPGAWQDEPSEPDVVAKYRGKTFAF